MGGEEDYAQKVYQPWRKGGLCAEGVPTMGERKDCAQKGVPTMGGEGGLCAEFFPPFLRRMDPFLRLILS